MSFVTFKNCKISAIKTVIPKDFINIDNETEFFGHSEKKLERAKKILGFGKRHYVDEKTTALDLGYEAAKELIKKTGIERSEIDTLLFLSVCRDYTVPTSANVLHGLLDLAENCAVTDISQGCSGFVYALWMAHSLIQSGASKKLLLISADTFSRYSCRENRLVSPIFGDSASAVLLEYSPEESFSFFSLGSKGKDYDKIICPAGGARIPVDNQISDKVVTDKFNNPYKLNHLMMSGIDVFDFTLEYVPKAVNEILDYAGMSDKDISMYLLHQANKQIVQSVAQKAEIPLEKTPVNTFSEYGNNSCNSIGVHITNNIFNMSGNILLCGYGVGMSWASAILKADSINNLGISTYEDTKNTKSKEELKEYWYNRFITKEEEH